jgi:hypothetical protein
MNIEDAKLDFAPHYLQVEAHLKTVHDLVKQHKYLDAATFVDQIIVESRLLRNAIKTHVK